MLFGGGGTQEGGPGLNKGSVEPKLRFYSQQKGGFGRDFYSQFIHNRRLTQKTRSLAGRLSHKARQCEPSEALAYQRKAAGQRRAERAKPI